MGIVDLLMNELVASPGDPLGVVIGRLVGGEHATPDGPHGGLPGLLARFDKAGLGNIAQSWVANGPNLPVTADQLRRALGDSEVAELVRHSKMPERDILPMVAEHLPAVVDRLTPDGRLPLSA